MTKTTTSAFGAGKREAHDTSALHSRSLLNGIASEDCALAERRVASATGEGQCLDI
jgi:hypothetical protein